MIYRGTIILNKELTFTQAESLRLLFRQSFENRKYNRIPMNIQSDGKSLVWNGDKDAFGLEFALADIINDYLSKWKIDCMGIIGVIDTDKILSYEIIMLKNKVKTFINNKISDVNPSR
jgi:predicted MarR family transcription regulator